MTVQEERLLWWQMRHLSWWEDIFLKHYYRPDLAPNREEPCLQLHT